MPTNLIVATNLGHLDQSVHPGILVETLPPSLAGGIAGARRLLRDYHHADVILINDEPDVLLNLCVARWLSPRCLFGGPRIWSIDIVLNTPRSMRDHIEAIAKRLLLMRVDHFVHYFKDLTGYERYFGISSLRSSFVPFKVNFWPLVENDRAANPDGDYVFTSGISLRDYDTFMQAMAKAALPGLLIYLGEELCHENGTPFPPPFIAPQVRLVEDDGNSQTWVSAVRRARIVVIPILPNAIRAAGISVALIAMALGKCVVITDGATTRGIFGDEVLLTPPGDVDALAELLRRAWDDVELRRRYGLAARRYAEPIGDKAMLNERIMRLLAQRCIAP